MSARISALQIEQRRRARLPWSRWLPDREPDAVITKLEADREILRSQYGTLQTVRLRAEVDEQNAARAFCVAQAEAELDRKASIRLSEKRLTVLARARKLLIRVPGLAFGGAKHLLAMASRIERAREQGYDSGPNVSAS